MQAVTVDVYDHPQYYDLAFGSDWRAERDFLIRCFQKYARRDVKAVFEPACGTGRLMFRLARSGYSPWGVDLNAKAVAFCNQRLQQHQLPGKAILGDMRAFRLPSRVDAAFNTINSFRHLASERAAADHLRCVADHLRPGGLYIIGLHLTPTLASPTDEEAWSARRGHLCVNTRIWNVRRDPRRRRERFQMTYDVFTPTRQFQMGGELVLRTYTARQFERLLAQVNAFELAATHDFAYRIQRTITVGPATEDVVYVLRKR